MKTFAGHEMNLLSQLEEQTDNLSSSEMIRQTPAYVELKARGKSVVGPLLSALEHTPNMAFMMLLADVTGENPVPREDRGDVEKMAAAWLRWHNKNGATPD